MAAPATDVASLRLSTDALAERDRLPYWREEISRRLFRTEVSPLGEAPFHVRAVLTDLSGARIATCTTSAIRYERTSSIMAQGGGEGPSMTINLGRSALAIQRSSEVALGPGDAIFLSHVEPSAFTTAGGSYVGVFLPAAGLRSVISEAALAEPRLISRSGTALRLLVGYLSAIREELTIGEPELRLRIATHVHDLVAMAVGATRDGAAIAAGRGVRAARLRAVKADIAVNLANRDLSVGAVALRQGVTPRYIHMLFEGEGTTFSEFVREARLARAYGLLVDPRLADGTITAVAFACGFGDLSYFNHTFRRRYGATPTEVRGKGRPQ